jgi:hypothetical protein
VDFFKKIKIRFGYFLMMRIAVTLIFMSAIPALAAPSIEGSLETTGNVYTSHDQYYNRTKIQYRAYENVAFDATFNEHWFFRFNSRAIYQTQKIGTIGNWILNFFYGYLDYDNDYFSLQAGRIMDFNNLVYVYFDGLNLESKIKLGEHKLTLDLYGGYIVKDDYLEEYRNPWILRSFNSTDIRNMFIVQRRGDYVAGFKAELFAKKAGVFGIDYQMIFNRAALAEHYVSLNFETMFSKFFKLYGYGTLDLVELLPSNTLAAVQINPVDLLSIVFEHEYYRPVFIKNSYFWVYFKPYGNQDVNAKIIFLISKLLSIDFRYGVILYEATPDPGNQVSINLEHRDILKFGMKINTDLIVGPEGNLITLQVALKRHILFLDLLAGGGVEFYNDKSIASGLATGYFATVGTDIEIIKSVILSATGEFSSNQEYRYHVRGNISLKYIF